MRRLGIGVAVVAALAVIAVLSYREMKKPTVTVGRNSFAKATSDFTVGNLPPPMADDAAAAAKFSLVSGRRDELVGDLSTLHDGIVPPADHLLSHFFCFDHHTGGGRILVDLGRPVRIKQVNSYSLHSEARAGQVYKLYGNDGLAAGFDPRASGAAPDPAAAGWSHVASVDTRVPGENPFGQFAVSVATRGGMPLGRYRYLLFDVSSTESTHPYSNTQYAEIDVIDADAPPVKRAAVYPPAAPAGSGPGSPRGR